MSALAEALEAPAAEDALRARNDALAAENGRLRKSLTAAHTQLENIRRVAEYSGRSLDPPKWLNRKAPKDTKTAALVTVLSDTHFDEVVNPSEIGGRNAYNRKIAELRLERYFENVVLLSRHYLSGMDYQGIVVCLGGDIISGDIHEELSQSNEAHTLDTVIHWSGRIAAGLAGLADEFGAVHVPVVVGNHGRRSRKPRAKGRVKDNYDWLIGQLLARHFDRDARVTFDIPDSADLMFSAAGMRFLLTHGDQVSGGGGIGGHWPPLMRMIARKRARYQFDALLCGHWHSLIMAPTQGLVVNGSLKGEDEYSAIMGFKPEPPQQALFTVAPGHGVTFSAPVHVLDRKREGW